MEKDICKLRKALREPKKIAIVLLSTKLGRLLPDKEYICILYWLTFGKKLNLSSPRSFSEKLQWLKLYDRKPEYTMMVDKYEVKKYISRMIGEEYVIPTLGVWNSFDEIDFAMLPDQFVLKCTHDSGGLVICRDKKTLNIQEAKKKISLCLKENFYWHGREWPYKDVTPRIIAEKYMEESEHHELRDYKFFSFDGVTKAMFIATDRFSDGKETRFDFFDVNFNHLPFTNGHPNATIMPEKPKCFEEMKRLADKLSKGIPQLRVDFYEVEGKVYFGELTFSHWSGLMPFRPQEWDDTFGDWITLPSLKREQ